MYSGYVKKAYPTFVRANPTVLGCWARNAPRSVVEAPPHLTRLRELQLKGEDWGTMKISSLTLERLTLRSYRSHSSLRVLGSLPALLHLEVYSNNIPSQRQQMDRTFAIFSALQTFEVMEFWNLGSQMMFKDIRSLLEAAANLVGLELCDVHALAALEYLSSDPSQMEPLTLNTSKFSVL